MKLLLENWREYLNEDRISVEDIHNRADKLGIPWDDDAEFMSWTEDLTGKSHLDKMTDEELSLVYDALKKKDKGPIAIPTRDEIVQYISQFPDQKIHLDSPKGSSKAFGAGKENKVELPFDYGEYPGIINPADNMGWDVIIVPSSSGSDETLLPVGHVSYIKEQENKMGNDKIILAPDEDYTEGDKLIIDSFFAELPQFDDVVWY